MKIKRIAALGFASLMLAGIAVGQSLTRNLPAGVLAALNEAKAHRREMSTLKKNLRTFDTLDFDVYTHQKWDRLKESHSPDIVVHYPDGHTTKGLTAHIAELKPLFVFAPNTSIKVHPIKIGQGEWTAVVGVMSGTFSKPMPLGNGKFAQPTNKRFKFEMCTVGHWNKNGVMDEEWLFYDNAGFMKQIGLGG